MDDNVISVNFTERRETLPTEAFADQLVEMVVAETPTSDVITLTNHTLGIQVDMFYDPISDYGSVYTTNVEADTAFGDECLAFLFGSQTNLSADQMRFYAQLYQELFMKLTDAPYFVVINFDTVTMQLICKPRSAKGSIGVVVTQLEKSCG